MGSDEFICDVRWHDCRVGQAAPSRVHAIAKTTDRKQTGCEAVAWKRAIRYARKRRIPLVFWPLIATAILLGIIFERRPLTVFSSAGRRPTSDDEGAATSAQPNGEQGGEGLPADTGRGNRSELGPQYRPSAWFLAKDAAQVVAFLIRNRGKIHTPVVRAHWEHIDQFSIPLAIYLRGVEAADAWKDLETEISAAPFGAPLTPRAQMPRSMRRRNILRLLPEWARRGEELLSLDPDYGLTPTPSLDDVANDDTDTKPRRP